MAEELEVEIDSEGRVRVLTQGIKGKKCLDWVEVFRQLLSGQVEDQYLTPEYNQVETNETTHTQQHIRGRIEM